MVRSSSRPHRLMCPLLRGFHASAQALVRPKLHEFSRPSGYPGSWEPAGEPLEVWVQLERLRKGYARDVRDLWRQYTYEVQLMEAERQRKAEARVANEERKATKAAAAKTRAAERRAFEQGFRQALMKERAEKLESWRKKAKLKEQKKADHKDLLRKKSGMWVAEYKLEEKILDAFTQTTPL
ncbi:uncharacterized protein LOC133906784 [Phragmites australis]|uniref:uncharacterized protein LOC133906784 n=1 Tax=Phragmites australis TaxID=29695 RepID=UPI002D766141|nr:uncharacterized protein LOC133906784 [Phragmites australis]